MIASDRHVPDLPLEAEGVERRGGVMDRYVLSRLFALVVVPGACGFGAWGILLVPWDEPAPLILFGALPTVGFAYVVLYRLLTRQRFPLGPLVPFLLAALVFLIWMIDLAQSVASDPNGAYIPIPQVYSGFLEPWPGVIGGVVSFVRSVPSPPATRTGPR
ncbi:MAG: hypothetical protein ACJ72E_05760 [Marmoricola sp.]